MMTQTEFEEAMNDRDYIEDQERDERVREAAHKMLAALKECRKVLGIRNDFVPLGAALTLAPIIESAIRAAEGK